MSIDHARSISAKSALRISGKLRDELLNGEIVHTPKEAEILIAATSLKPELAMD
jgi:hypothetical protein